MIATMKKYTFLVFHRDYHAFLEKMGKLGVLHVIERQKSVEEDDDALGGKREHLERVESTLSLLDKATPEEDEQKIASPGDQVPDAASLMEKVEALDDEIDSLETRLEEIHKEILRLEPWGDYGPEDIKKLRDAGMQVRLYRCTSQEFDPSWEEEYSLFTINRSAGTVFFMVISDKDQEVSIDAEQVRPAEQSLSHLKEKQEEDREELDGARERMAAYAVHHKEMLEREKERVASELELETIYLETQKASEDTLRVLEGWVPVTAEEELLEWVNNEDVISLVTPPEEGETPPVELKNGPFARLFEPISKLFDLPNYQELDLTPYFAPFFMLFFGFCLGDAGYGVFFILFAAILKLKASKEFKPILTLTQYLGVGTILFGLLSGTFFGINLIDTGYTLTETSLQNLAGTEVSQRAVTELEPMAGEYYKSRAEFLEAVKANGGEELVADHETTILKQAEAGVPFVASFRHLMQDSLGMFYLSLLIGGLQILFGQFLKIMNITRKKGFKYALSTVGWFILAITVILRFGGILEGAILVNVYYTLLGVAGVMIFFLNNPDKNVFVRFGSAIWDSYNMVTGVFGDLLSYIRLFALGISSAILGFVFNDISMQLLDVPYVGWLFFLILLLFGHSINLFMASLGGFIHPMRLTFVEFYKNAGFEGGGKKYKPFIIHKQSRKEQ